MQKYKASYRHDGSVRVIVAQGQPGIAGNWVQSFGHVHGGMSLRLIGTQGEPPQVTLRRIALTVLQERGEEALQDIVPIISGEVAQ